MEIHWFCKLFFLIRVFLNAFREIENLDFPLFFQGFRAHGWYTKRVDFKKIFQSDKTKNHPKVGAAKNELDTYNNYVEQTDKDFDTAEL